MDAPIELKVTEAEAGQRLDRFLVLRLGTVGRAGAKRFLSDGRVLVDGHQLPKGALLRAGQRVQVLPVLGTDLTSTVPGTDLGRDPPRVVHEDASLLVVDKPAGLPSHGLRVGEPHTLTAWLLSRYPELATVGYRPLEPGLVHRLDTDTSGLLLVARDASTFAALVRALRAGEIDKRYVALCAGRVVAPRVFDGYLVSDRRARVKVSSRPEPRSRAAHTELLTSTPVNTAAVDDGGDLSLVSVRAPHAGRHQIRAHLAAAGHPLVGDTLYGGPPVPGLHRHFLHASELHLRHPVSGAPLHMEAPLPPELQGLIGGT